MLPRYIRYGDISDMGGQLLVNTLWASQGLVQTLMYNVRNINKQFTFCEGSCEVRLHAQVVDQHDGQVLLHVSGDQMTCT